MSRSGVTRMELVVPIADGDDRWALEEQDMPETPLHQRIVDLLVMILSAWIARTGLHAMAGSNIALRWNKARPSTGVDPDVYLVEPAPPEGEGTTSLCLWRPGHHAPRVAVEVVSEATAEKDYRDGPARYAVSGTRELWVFDPLRVGPREDGGPWVLQVWRRVKGRQFKRVYAGDGPTFSREFGAWLVVTDGGARLRIADDAAGTRLWPTAAEAERTTREEAEREVARLRAELARLRGGEP